MNIRAYNDIMRKSLFLVTLFIGVSSTLLIAQSRHYSAQSMAMGGGGTAYMDGYHANFLNPANLMLDIHRSKTTVGFMNFGVKAGGSMANIAVYNKYLTTGRLIAGETRTNMLNEWFGESSYNSRKIAATLSMAPFGVSHRRAGQAFSLASRVRISEDFTINKGMAELLTYGLDSEKFSNPTPINFSSNTIAFAEISVGYARHLDFIKIPDIAFAKDIKVYAGIAPKYLYGIYTADLNFNSTLQIDRGDENNPFTIHHDFNYTLQTIGELSKQLQEYEAAYNQNDDAEFGEYVEIEDVSNDLTSPQATGFGLDIGGTIEMDISALPIPLFLGKEKTLRVSMSLTDLGRLNFDKNASSVYAEDGIEYRGAGQGDDFGSYFDNLSDSLQNKVYGRFSSQEIDAITYELPAMYNFGASLEMGNLLLALDFGMGFNDTGINSKRSALSLGAQYRLLGFMPIRVGTRVGGYSSASYSAGFGFDFNFLEFTIGASLVGNSENYGSSAGVAWSGLVIRF